MKPSHLVATLTVALCAVPAAAADKPGFDIPKGNEAWIHYLSDFTRNGEMLADPQRFMAALHAVSEPGFVAAAVNAMLDPVLYARSMASLMDPRAYGNFARAMDPNVIATWSRAVTDPQFFAALQAVLGDPGKLMRWMMLPMDPKLLAAGMNALNPNNLTRWATAPMNPQVIGMASAPMNPNWYGAWMSSMGNPQSYGPSMGGMMRAPGYAVPVPMMYPMPVPAIPTPR